MATPYPYPTDENDPTLSAAERAYLALTKKWDWDAVTPAATCNAPSPNPAVGLERPAGRARDLIVEKWRA